MERVQQNSEQGSSLGIVVAIYYTVLLAAFGIGLYGLFTLFWMATSTIRPVVMGLEL
jgi:hypothetical protein